MSTLFEYRFKDGTGLSVETIKDVRMDSEYPVVRFRFKEGRQSLTLEAPLIDRDTGENVAELLCNALAEKVLKKEEASSGVTIKKETEEKEEKGSMPNLGIRKCEECNCTYKPASPRQKRCNKCRQVVKT
jgi:hypothetical protein